MPHAHPFLHQDALERRYDGPVPVAPPTSAPARERVFRRLAAETARELCRRRAGLAAAAAVVDPRLRALGGALLFYRGQGAGWAA